MRYPEESTASRERMQPTTNNQDTSHFPEEEVYYNAETNAYENYRILFSEKPDENNQISTYRGRVGSSSIRPVQFSGEYLDANTLRKIQERYSLKAGDEFIAKIIYDAQGRVEKLLVFGIR